MKRYISGLLALGAPLLALVGTAGALGAEDGVDPAPGDVGRCATYLLEGDENEVSLSLFVGGFSSPMRGRLTLALGDPTTGPQPPGFVGVRVTALRLLATDWMPNSATLPEPTMFLLDLGMASVGRWRPSTGEIRFALHVTTLEGPLPVPMPIVLEGTLLGDVLRVQGDNGDVSDGMIAMTIRATEVDCRGELLFSTEIGFTASAGGGLTLVSDGDALGEVSCVVQRHEDLIANLAFKPVVPPLGLDALTNTAFGPTFFSLEEPQFSATLGPVSDGDLLSDEGRIVRTNRQLLAAFMPSTEEDLGLDGAHLGEYPFDATNGDLFFSTERSFFSSAMNASIGHGDVLSVRGFVLLTNRQLLAPFEPACEDGDPCERDFGLDALHILPSGEVLFSVEESFESAALGGWVSDGDVLSSEGRVVRGNLALVEACAPLEDVANFGLDALDLNPCRRCHLLCLADFNDDGRVGSDDLAYLLGSWGPGLARADLNGDGAVGSGDLALLLGSWGPCSNN